jgi:hypothetical protein
MGITETNIRKLLSVFGVNQVPPQTLKGVKGILDTALPPVPISASFLLYTSTGSGNIQSLFAKLDYSTTIADNFIKTSQTFFVLVTINRGTYWGDCNLSMIAPPQFLLLESNPIPPSISQNETQTAIAFEFTPDAAGKYTAVFQLDCDGVIISRTLEVTVESESNYGYGYGGGGLGEELLK